MALVYDIMMSEISPGYMTTKLNIKDYRCPTCGKLLFRAHIPVLPGLRIEIRCKCARMVIIESESKMSLSRSELKHWAERWSNCAPATYPPEIRTHDGKCSLCGEVCNTGHQCTEVTEYIRKENEDVTNQSE